MFQFVMSVWIATLTMMVLLFAASIHKGDG